MPTKIHLNESDLKLASVSLCRLGSQLADAPTPPPGSINTHNIDTNISVSEFLRALRFAHYALIDATRSTSAELAEMLSDHSELDALLASRFSHTYAVPGQPA